MRQYLPTRLIATSVTLPRSAVHRPSRRIITSCVKPPIEFALDHILTTREYPGPIGSASNFVRYCRTNYCVLLYFEVLHLTIAFTLWVNLEEVRIPPHLPQTVLILNVQPDLLPLYYDTPPFSIFTPSEMYQPRLASTRSAFTTII